jgi:hypothetical protein
MNKKNKYTIEVDCEFIYAVEKLKDYLYKGENCSYKEYC